MGCPIGFTPKVTECSAEEANVNIDNRVGETAENLPENIRYEYF